MRRDNILDQMIPYALRAVQVFEKNGKIESRISTYAANYGVAVIQSGKCATYLFYDNKDNRINKALEEIAAMGQEEKPLYELDKKTILKAATALKLAIRTYSTADNSDGDNHD
jgi:CRISPR/Cas system CMR-associated protein Cmr5 small subunit